MSPATLDPGATGWVVITNRRHHNPAGVLPGCVEHEAVFNDPAETLAEYLTASVAAAVGIYQERLSPMSLRRIRLRRAPELVEVTLSTSGTYVDALDHTPVPLTPSRTSQQWGQFWAANGHQGVCTGLPIAPPLGTRNLWTCVFLHAQAALAVKNVGPVPSL